MKLSEIRLKTKSILKEHNIDITDADYIIAEIIKKPRTELFIDCDVSGENYEEIMNCINKRIKHMPVSKIFNKAYFYGEEFYINEDVLSPRPETELLVDEVLKEVKSRNEDVEVLDLCTGSGIIACCVKLNSGAKVTASDISNKALKVAKENAKRLGVDIKFKQSDMFENLNSKFDIIVSNPPYIETEVCSTLDLEVKNYDPILALDGGVDGLDFYKKIYNNLNKLKIGGKLFLEIGYNQAENLKKIFKNKKIKIIKDFNNLDRIAIINN